MIIIDWNDFAENGINSKQPVSFTTGVFDGLHRGHHQLMECLINQAGTIPVTATFKSNPFLLLKPKNYKGDILSLNQKINLLEQQGCEIVILIDFSMEFSRLSGRDFFAYVRKHLNLSHLVLGLDHKLGNKGDTSSLQAKKQLEPEGIIVDIVEPLIEGGTAISSTRIRAAIEDGDLCTVEKLLGRKHVLDLADLSYINNGNSPYLRRNDIKQVIPFKGKYAVMLENGNETFATEIKFNEDRLVFEKKPDFQAKTLTFNCHL